jgi:hypothetical protein
VSNGTLAKKSKEKLVTTVDVLAQELSEAKQNVVCKPCRMGKQPKGYHPPLKAGSTHQPGSLHSGVLEMPVGSVQGFRYVLAVVDE